MGDSINNASDSQLLAMLDQMRTTIAANLASYPNITPAIVGDLDTLRDEYNDDLTAHVNAAAQAKSKRIVKDEKRDEVEAKMREVRGIAKASGATEAALAALGIPAPEGGAPSNATVPASLVNTGERLRHTISWTDAGTPNNKKKPLGALGAEIWVKIDGPPPGNESDCTFLSLDAFTPYMKEYDASDAGKMAHYMMRWRMKDGSVGAFGETVSATITG